MVQNIPGKNPKNNQNIVSAKWNSSAKQSTKRDQENFFRNSFENAKIKYLSGTKVEDWQLLQNYLVP